MGNRFLSSPWSSDLLWGQSIFLYNGYWVLFSGRGEKLTTHLHLGQRLRMVKRNLSSPIRLYCVVFNLSSGKSFTFILTIRSYEDCVTHPVIEQRSKHEYSASMYQVARELDEWNNLSWAEFNRVKFSSVTRPWRLLMNRTEVSASRFYGVKGLLRFWVRSWRELWRSKCKLLLCVFIYWGRKGYIV